MARGRQALTRLTSLVLGAVLATAACSDPFGDPDPNRLLDGGTPPSTPDLRVDTAASLSVLPDLGYTDPAKFTQASVMYPSTKDPVAIVDWVSNDAVAAYANIVPQADAGPANVTLPTGAMIVRVVYDLPDAGGDGSVRALTVLVKGPPGTDQDLGDWWFAVTDPDGTPLPAADGGLEVGPLTDECHSCHRARGAANDFLFGVPIDQRLSDP